MVKAKGGLGRGLGALLPVFDEIDEIDKDFGQQVELLAVDKIIANVDQPRKYFDEDDMDELVKSIQEHGVLQPIIVAPRDGQYLLVAGERRWRASKAAGLEKIPALIKPLSDSQIFELALIENIQRSNLNPIEEAQGYRQLVDRFGYSTGHIAKRMGKSRPQIANALRLLALPPEVLEFVIDGRLSVGHIRPLLALDDSQWQVDFVHEIYQNNLSVRNVEAMIGEIKKRGSLIKVTEEILFKEEKPKTPLSADLISLQEQMKVKLGTKVIIKNNGKKGKIEIEFYGEEDLKRVIDSLGGEYY